MEPEKGTFCVIKARNQSNKNLRHMLLGGRIKGKSEKMKKTKTVGGSPANLRLITLNNPCSILKKKKNGTAILLLRVLVLWTKKKKNVC